MPPSPRNVRFPNPFYVLLLLVSTAFVVTALAYTASPYITRQAVEQPEAPPSPGSKALAAWFDRHGPLALGVEVVAMLAAGSLAMATDHWFSPSKAKKSPGTGNSGSLGS